MVVSLKDYIEHYADSRVQEFLSAMFKNHTVLFVGYGLAELEVLEHIIRSDESLRTGSAEPRHFLLFPFRSTESVQARFIEHFFRDQCGVRVTPYCIDAKGYPELVEVFKGWSPELEVRGPATLDLQTHLDRYVASPTDVNRRAALSLVESRPELASYLLNSLKDPVWFSDLDDARFCEAEHNPKVRAIEGERGTLYQADGWPALRYLEQIAASVTDEQAARIANIVRAISADAEERGLDNWRTWWSFATVLSQLPLDVLTVDDIEMTRRWLTGRFDSDMVGQELGAKLLPRLLDSPTPMNWHKAMLLVDALSMVQATKEAA